MQETITLVGFISVLIFIIIILGMILICCNKRFATVVTKIVEMKINLNIELSLKKGDDKQDKTKK